MNIKYILDQCKSSCLIRIDRTGEVAFFSKTTWFFQTWYL